MKLSVVIYMWDGNPIFKFYEHPEISVQIEVMKTEVMKYQALTDSITSFEERKDIKGRDTFDLSDGGSPTMQRYHYSHFMLCVVQTNSPNSCPRVSLASSIQLTMTIRKSLRPSTLNYPFRHSLTNEHCSSRVTR